MITTPLDLILIDNTRIYGQTVTLFPHDEDTASDPTYYGYLSKEGHWMIAKRDGTGATTTTRFAFGKASDAYTTNFTNRAALTYTYINLVGV